MEASVPLARARKHDSHAFVEGQWLVRWWVRHDIDGPAGDCIGESCASSCTGFHCGRALLPLLILHGRVRVTLKPRLSIESKAMRYGVAGTSLMVGTYYVEASVRLTRARKHDSQAFVEGQWFVRWCVPHDIDGF